MADPITLDGVTFAAPTLDAVTLDEVTLGAPSGGGGGSGLTSLDDVAGLAHWYEAEFMTATVPHNGNITSWTDMKGSAHAAGSNAPNLLHGALNGLATAEYVAARVESSAVSIGVGPAQPFSFVLVVKFDTWADNGGGLGFDLSASFAALRQETSSPNVAVFDNNAAAIVSSLFPATLGTWFVLILLVNGANSKLFANGVQVGSTFMLTSGAGDDFQWGGFSSANCEFAEVGMYEADIEADVAAITTFLKDEKYAF